MGTPASMSGNAPHSPSTTRPINSAQFPKKDSFTSTATLARLEATPPVAAARAELSACPVRASDATSAT